MKVIHRVQRSIQKDSLQKVLYNYYIKDDIAQH